MIYDQFLGLFRELISRVEVRLLRHVGDVAPDGQRNLRRLDHAVEVPRVAHLVGGLMVMGGVVSLELFLAPLLRMSDVLVPFLQTDRRHANFRKREVV